MALGSRMASTWPYCRDRNNGRCRGSHGSARAVPSSLEGRASTLSTTGVSALCRPASRLRNDAEAMWTFISWTPPTLYLQHCSCNTQPASSGFPLGVWYFKLNGNQQAPYELATLVGKGMGKKRSPVSEAVASCLPLWELSHTDVS